MEHQEHERHEGPSDQRRLPPFIVLGQAPKARGPGETPLDDPITIPSEAVSGI
jgi:hypothetical protein